MVLKSLRANFYTLNVKICVQAKSRIYIYTLNVKSKRQGTTTQSSILKNFSGDKYFSRKSLQIASL